MTFKDFDAAMQSVGRPVAVLGGRKWEFRAPAKMSWERWNKLMLALEERGSVQEEINKTKSILTSLVIKSQRGDFAKMLDYEGSDADDEDDNTPLAANSQIGELLDWLLETYSGKPQSSESESSDSQPESGEPLNVVSIKRKG